MTPDKDTETVPQRGHAPLRKAEPAAETRLARGEAVGRFLVLDHIGQGGMGTVYAAWDPQLSRRVALKVLRPESDATERARILREARALAQLTHPNVVRVYELGEIDHAPFIAMELIDGSSLKDLLRNPLPESRRFELFAEAGRGLAAVHGLGIVHRDFKPANVFVGFDRRVCIGDFGLAIASGEDDSAGRGLPAPEHTPTPARLDEALTQQGTVVGTPAYMAPEQLKGEPLDARCDQFSFAVALWSALYDERAFPDGAKGLQRDPPPRPRRASFAGRSVERVLRRALAQRKEDRFADMPTFLRALDVARHRPQRLALGAAAVVVLGALLGLIIPRFLETDPCGVKARAASSFPADVRARLRAATTNPLSDIGAHVDAYTAQWLTAAEAVCRREDIPHRPTVQACLDRRLGDLTALAQVLSAHPDAIDAALPAVLAMRTPQSCLNERPTEGSARSDTTGTLERRLAEARAASMAGRHVEALPLATDLVAAARAVGDVALEAEAQRVVGMAAIGTGDLPLAEKALRAAIAGAMLTHAERLEAECWTELLGVVGDRARRYDEAQRLVAIVRASAARLPEDVELLSQERFAEAVLLGDVGDLAAASPLAAEAVTLAEQRVPRDPRLVSKTHSAYGNLLASLGQVDAGIKELEAARRALDGALPPTHVSFASVENNIGLLYQRKGDRAAARRAFEASVKIFEASGKNPVVGVPLDNLATLAREEGRTADARALYERAGQIFLERFGPNHERTVNTRLGLGLVLQDEGHFAEAAPLISQAVETLVAQNPNTRPTLEALLARATLAFEAGAPTAELSAAIAAVYAHLVINDDLKGPRAELALLEAAKAIEAKDLPTARTALATARAGAASVRWYGFDSVVDGWALLADGRAPACASLVSGVPLSRKLRPRCH